MGGVIGVASEQDRGSTFWFEIRMEPVAAAAVLSMPATRAAPARLAAAAATPAMPVPSATAAAGPRILVVEDNAVNREVAAGMLENLGYQSELAINGLLALEAIAESAYAAVLMDCQMPVMDGLTATEEIRRREAGSGGRVPIIALTANAMEANRERCLAAGMDDFLPKPFSQMQLSAVLGRWAPAAQALQHDRAGPAAAETAQTTNTVVVAATHIAVIDTEVLRNIAALGRPALLGSLIDLYLEHSPPLLATIESAIQGREPTGLAEALHTLKSSSANLGGARLTELLRECEALAHRGAGGSIPARARARRLSRILRGADPRTIGRGGIRGACAHDHSRQRRRARPNGTHRRRRSRRASAARHGTRDVGISRDLGRQRRRRARRVSLAAGRLHHSRRGHAGHERFRDVHARCARCPIATTCPS